MTNLARWVLDNAQRSPEAEAVSGAGESFSYGELDLRANQIARALRERGIRAGDRVALFSEKSPRTIAAMQAVLRLGATYVPISPHTPKSRADLILRDCEISALVCGQAQTSLFESPGIQTLGLHRDWGEVCGLSGTLVSELASRASCAYILYTSGSTGIPKGVCCSHDNARAFVQWAADVVAGVPDDRFSNHAAFNFDLSVFDIYAAFCTGASVHIIPEGASYNPTALVEFLTAQRISVWYSVPAALILMMDRGGLTESTHALRYLFFAGEPFPIERLRELRKHWPNVPMMNLYGPTETNVCTAFSVPSDLSPYDRGIPIGKAASGDRIWLEAKEGDDSGTGEIVVDGPTVMMGYWGKPPQVGPYHTGDIGSLGSDGEIFFHGRRDHMVKVRGFRIELGDIEVAVLRHPDVEEAAAFVYGTGVDARLVVAVASTAPKPPGLLTLKKHCAESLPPYMLPDATVRCSVLPRTPNGKVDRNELMKLFENTRRNKG